MSATIARVRGVLFFALHPKRLLGVIGSLVGAMLYVWFASVRAVPGVRRRKTKAREAWRDRERRVASRASDHPEV
jgi:hypothetical protein